MKFIVSVGFNFIRFLNESITKMAAINVAKQFSVKRVTYLTKKLKLNNIIRNKNIDIQIPIHKRNSRKPILNFLIIKKKKLIINK